MDSGCEPEESDATAELEVTLAIRRPAAPPEITNPSLRATQESSGISNVRPFTIRETTPRVRARSPVSVDSANCLGKTANLSSCDAPLAVSR